MRRPISFVFIATFILFLLMSICSTTVRAADENADENASGGKFTLEYKQYEGKGHQMLYKLLTESGVFDKAVEQLNKTFVLPKDIGIVFDNAKGSYYSPREKTIHMSYPTMWTTYVLYKKVYPDESEESVREYILDVNRYILYHEIGHALVDIYDLPIIGDRETSADNLSAIYSLEFTHDGFNILVDAADWFDLYYEAKVLGDPEEKESTFWDEHRMDAQRYYYLLCMAYGKYPKETAEELASYDDKNLDEFIKEKGDSCQAFYQDSYDKWMRLLKPHLVKGAE